MTQFLIHWLVSVVVFYLLCSCVSSVCDALYRDQVVGWPPRGSYRKNTLAANATKTKVENKDDCVHYDQICLADLSTLSSSHLKKAAFFSFRFMSAYKANSTTPSNHENKYSCKTSTRDRLTNGSRINALRDQEYVLTYEDKDADWSSLAIFLGSETAGNCSSYPRTQSAGGK
ncbi:Auxin-responsive protein IAA19 [Triticum urartu]|uniref:Auxin-responsive protein n=1 Tax=Triticum urartu TaxID=4572 RepID=M8A1Z4_TRIUA|nr:Auxin-responsive protein IAA19 [Triticum urartu]